MTVDETLDVAIVGAGFSGVATAAALKRYGVRDIRLLETGSNYGSFWTHTYDRLSLHSPWHGLPDDDGLVDRYPVFKTRLEVIDYLERYAANHDLLSQTAFEEHVDAVMQVDAGLSHPWQLDTAKRRYRARQVVVATGYCRRPIIPSLPGQTDYRGRVLHSASYRNGQPFRNQRVLIVGSGNSAFEIALDLVEAEAASVTLLVHGPRWVIPMDAYESAMKEARAKGEFSAAAITAAHPAPRGSNDFSNWVAGFDDLLRRLAIDVVDIGLAQPRLGPWREALENGRVSVFDHGTVPLIRQGAIKILNDKLVGMHGDEVNFAKHAPAHFDAVVLATGFGPGINEFIRDTCLFGDVARVGSFPVTDGRCKARSASGLYFVGYDLSPWGGMAHGHWGYEVGERIATELGTFHPRLRPRDFSKAPWIQ